MRQGLQRRVVSNLVLTNQRLQLRGKVLGLVTRGGNYQHRHLPSQRASNPRTCLINRSDVQGFIPHARGNPFEFRVSQRCREKPTKCGGCARCHVLRFLFSIHTRLCFHPPQPVPTQIGNVRRNRVLVRLALIQPPQRGVGNGANKGLTVQASHR